MPRKTLAEWLRQELRRHEWTQADLARKSGLSQGRISDWLSDKRLPNPESCDRLADALGADVDYVLMLAGHRPHDYEDLDPQLANLIAMLRRIRLTPDRENVMRSMLEGYLAYDRQRAPASKS